MRSGTMKRRHAWCMLAMLLGLGAGPAGAQSPTPTVTPANRGTAGAASSAGLRKSGEPTRSS